MPKMKILVTIVNEEENISYETTSILQDNVLKYKENNNTMVFYDYEKNSLVRENAELRMDYSFDVSRKTEGSIEIKELGRKMSIPIETKKLERKNNDIEIKYQVEGMEFLYKIEVIE